MISLVDEEWITTGKWLQLVLQIFITEINRTSEGKTTQIHLEKGS